MASSIDASTSGAGGVITTADNSGVLNIKTAGTTAVTVDASQNVGIGTTSPSGKLQIVGTSAADTYLRVSNTNGGVYATYLNIDSSNATGSRYNGIYSSNSGTYQWSIGGGGSDSTMAFSTGSSNTERMRIDSSGNLLVGGTSAVGSSRLLVKGSGSSSSTTNLYVQNSSGTDILYMRDDGAVNTGTTTSSPYNLTTASGANAVLGSDGFLRRSTSSLKYKTDVEDATHGLNEVMQLRSVTYKGVNDGDTVFGGLIAEEVHDTGLTEFVQYAEDGTPDALAYGQMVSLAFKAIQELKAIVDAQQQEINALKGVA